MYMHRRILKQAKQTESGYKERIKTTNIHTISRFRYSGKAEETDKHEHAFCSRTWEDSKYN